MSESIRSLIEQKSLEAREPDKIGPHRCAELLVELSSLMSSLNKHRAERRFIYNQYLFECRKMCKSAVDAKMAAEADNRYKELLEADLQGAALKDLISSLKVYIRNATEEMRQMT